MKNYFRIIFLVLCLAGLLGCETFKGAMSDIANTATNIREIFTTGKTIHDATR